jgi:hypothetical protein
MFWLMVLAAVVVGFAVAWWSSGRVRRGVDADLMRRSKAQSEGETQRYSAPQPPYGRSY